MISLWYNLIFQEVHCVIREKLLGVKARIVNAASRIHRDGGDIRLVAVTKTVPPEKIRKAMSAGHFLFGENRVQEAKEKIAKFEHDGCWHLIGHLQKNKAKHRFPQYFGSFRRTR